MPGPRLGTWERMVSVTIMVLLSWSTQRGSGNGHMGASHPKWGKCCERTRVGPQGGTNEGCAANPDSVVKTDFLEEATSQLRLEFHQGKRDGNTVLKKESSVRELQAEGEREHGAFLETGIVKRNGDVKPGLNKCRTTLQSLNSIWGGCGML